MIATKPNRKLAPHRTRVNFKRLTQRRWTFEELAAAVPETNQPMELWDGELIMSPAPSFYHQKLVARFHRLLDDWVRTHRLGVTGLAPLDMVLSARRATQPDILFVSNGRLCIVQEQIMGAADLVVEITSPSSTRRDRIDKRDLYQQYGVKEYWLIDPEAETVEVLFLTRGEYRLFGRWRPGERAKSRLLEGFSITVRDLFAKELSA